ncbi:MAG: hypothetical protein K0R84_280 [Clostridia bacterium]|jgi:hypothetical protein|nr:hypothetical protein [Clostridia bacterium]
MEQLKEGIRKNKGMVRKAAPITIESRGFAKISIKMEQICKKLRKK